MIVYKAASRIRLPLLYAFLSAKKAFTPSRGARFRLIFISFECEGLDFQVFTPEMPGFEQETVVL